MTASFISPVKAVVINTGRYYCFNILDSVNSVLQVYIWDIVRRPVTDVVSDYWGPVVRTTEGLLPRFNRFVNEKLI